MQSHLKRLALPPVLVAAIMLGVAIWPDRASCDWTLGRPIVTYWSQRDSLNSVLAQRMRDAGMNTAWVYGSVYTSPSDMAAQLDVAAMYNLRTMLFDPIISPSSLDGGVKQAKLDAMIDQYKVSPNAYGYFLQDEPPVSDYAGLARLKNYINTRDPNHLAYINMELSTDLSQYITTVNPALLSYDRYQFMNRGDDPTYLDSLGKVSRRAHNAGIPMMNVVQACAWDPGWRIPTTNELRYLQSSTLAYGGQGIAYFNSYTQRPYTGGLDPYPDGSPSPVYTSLVSLGDRFEKIAANFANLHWIGTYIKGYQSGRQPTGTTVLPGGSAFTILDLSDSLTYSNFAMARGADIGLFSLADGGGSAPGDATFAMVAANDYSDGVKMFTVRGPGNLSYFDVATNRWIATGSNQVTLNLEPGGGTLVGLTSLVPSVPEPSVLVLLTTGLLSAGVLATKRRRFSVG